MNRRVGTSRAVAALVATLAGWLLLTTSLRASKSGDEVTPPRVPLATQPAIPSPENDTAGLIAQIEGDPGLACELSYEQTARAIASAGPNVNTGDFPPLKLSRREVFMKDCHDLPRKVQNCLVFQYAFAKQMECEVARREYDTENQRRITREARVWPQ
jgi:hypothetical protein